MVGDTPRGDAAPTANASSSANAQTPPSGGADGHGGGKASHRALILGAIGVVQMERPRALGWLRRRFVEEGVWVRPFGDVVYLMPPLTVDEQQTTALTGAVVKIMTEWSEGAGS